MSSLESKLSDSHEVLQIDETVADDEWHKNENKRQSVVEKLLQITNYGK